MKGDSTTSLSLGGGFALLLRASNLHLQPSRVCCHDMANVPPIYAFLLFAVVVVGTALVPPIQLMVLMGF